VAEEIGNRLEAVVVPGRVDDRREGGRIVGVLGRLAGGAETEDGDRHDSDAAPKRPAEMIFRAVSIHAVLPPRRADSRPPASAGFLA
jgi:hypothetical protein